MSDITLQEIETLIKQHGPTLYLPFFCFMFSWVELLLARTLTVTEAKPISAIMTRTISATGLDFGLLAAAGILTIVPGALVIWFVRNHMAKGFAMGRV
jgi:glycerol transport system permease protein